MMFLVSSYVLTIDYLIHRLAQDFQILLVKLWNTFSKGDKKIKRTEVKEEKFISEVLGTHTLKIQFPLRCLKLNSCTLSSNIKSYLKKEKSQSLF